MPLERSGWVTKAVSKEWLSVQTPEDFQAMVSIAKGADAIARARKKSIPPLQPRQDRHNDFLSLDYNNKLK